MIWLLCIFLTAIFIGGLLLTARLIGTPGRHADHDFSVPMRRQDPARDWDLLPRPVLEELQSTDLFLSYARSLLKGTP